MRGSWLADGSLIVLSIPIERAVEIAKLTKAERQVATLAARGWSTRKIASYRRVSPATVAKQIESIYRKLDVNSRATLASVLASRKETR